MTTSSTVMATINGMAALINVSDLKEPVPVSDGEMMFDDYFILASLS